MHWDKREKALDEAFIILQQKPYASIEVLQDAMQKLHLTRAIFSAASGYFSGTRAMTQPRLDSIQSLYLKVPIEDRPALGL